MGNHTGSIPVIGTNFFITKANVRTHLSSVQMSFLLSKGACCVGIFILTSMFNSGFGEDFSANLHRYITKRGLFAFVASDFHGHEKTDRYFDRFY